MENQEWPSPAFVIDESALRQNLILLDSVQERTGVSIILALKSFAAWSVFSLIKNYLRGTAASSLFETKLSVEEFGVKSHTYMVAFSPSQFEEVARHSSHLIFNSIGQYNRYESDLQKQGQPPSIGLRVNPGYSDAEREIWDPCVKGSRLGICYEEFPSGLPAMVEGLHFHCLCESSAESLELAIAHFEKLYGQHLAQLKWVNFGGGHLITDKNYSVDHLVKILNTFKSKYPHLEVFLEPGSAVVMNAGFLSSTIIDIVCNENIRTLILDISLGCHIPGVVEGYFHPRIKGASYPPEAGHHRYRIGGLSCLAGDYLDEYSFQEEQHIGDQLIFEDMLPYSFVKSTMFNGINHPAISILRENGEFEIVRTFQYSDFKNRLS